MNQRYGFTVHAHAHSVLSTDATTEATRAFRTASSILRAMPVERMTRKTACWSWSDQTSMSASSRTTTHGVVLRLIWILACTAIRPPRIDRIATPNSDLHWFQVVESPRPSNPLDRAGMNTMLLVSTLRCIIVATNAKAEAIPSRTLARGVVTSGNSIDRRSRAGRVYFAGSRSACRRLPQRSLSTLS